MAIKIDLLSAEWGRGLGAAAPIALGERNAPGRAHGTGTVYKCALVPSDLFRRPTVQRFFRQFLRPRQAGKGYEKRLDRLAVRVDGGRKHALQNQAMLDKSMVPGTAFLTTNTVQ